MSFGLQQQSLIRLQYLLWSALQSQALGNGPGRDVAIAWFTAVRDQGHVYAAFSSNAGGSRSASLAVSAIASGRSSGYPRLARRGNELIFAWVEPGERPQVRTAVAQMQ